MSTRKHPTRQEFDDFINQSPVPILHKEETEDVYNTGGQMYVRIKYAFKVPFTSDQYATYCKQQCLQQLWKNYLDNQRLAFQSAEDVLKDPKDNFDQEQPLTSQQKEVVVWFGKIWDELIDS